MYVVQPGPHLLTPPTPFSHLQYEGVYNFPEDVFDKALDAEEVQEADDDDVDARETAEYFVGDMEVDEDDIEDFMQDEILYEAGDLNEESDDDDEDDDEDDDDKEDTASDGPAARTRRAGGKEERGSGGVLRGSFCSSCF